MIEFGGWEMPVQYTSIIDEHLAVRTAAGMFDISHMGEFLVRGPAAEKFLNQMLTNDASRLAVGQGQYTLLCNERGGAIDDLYLYRLRPDEYLLIVNASRTSADFAWLERQLPARALPGSVELRDASDQLGALAIQGPRVADFIHQALPGNSTGGTVAGKVIDLKKNQIAKFAFVQKDIWVSRTGYTGEDGFEIVAPAELIEPLWQQLFVAGKPCGLKPAGLGARDTLRTEVCYPLYGHELDENTTPIEAGLGFFVALDKGEFVGRAALVDQKINGTAKKLIAFRMTDKSAPPRPQYPIWSAGPGPERIGQVVSGTQSPSLGTGIGMGYVRSEFATPKTSIEIEVRGRRWPAVIVPKPIYRKAD